MGSVPLELVTLASEYMMEEQEEGKEPRRGKLTHSRTELTTRT